MTARMVSSSWIGPAGTRFSMWQEASSTSTRADSMRGQHRIGGLVPEMSGPFRTEGPVSSGAEPLRGFRPVEHLPPCGDVVRTPVLVLEVVGVFPHINPEDRHLAIHQRCLLYTSPSPRD